MNYTQQALLRFGSTPKRGSSCVALEVDWQIRSTNHHLPLPRKPTSGSLQTGGLGGTGGFRDRPIDIKQSGRFTPYMLAHSVGHAVSRLVGQSRRAWQWKRCRFDVGDLKDSVSCMLQAPLQVAVAVPIETNRPSMIGCRTRGQRPQCPQGCPDSSSVGPGARLQGRRCLVRT